MDITCVSARQSTASQSPCQMINIMLSVQKSADGSVVQKPNPALSRLLETEAFVFLIVAAFQSLMSLPFTRLKLSLTVIHWGIGKEADNHLKPLYY